MSDEQMTDLKEQSMSTIEEVRAFWNANPCGRRLSNQEDRLQYFKEIEVRRYSAEWHILLVARFEESKGRRVLEIGCGMGTDGRQFAQNGADYFGIDLTPQGIELAKEQFEYFGCTGTFRVGNAEELPFEDHFFDHVYSFGVIHHSPHPETIVKEIFRMLKPGGTFCIMIYNRSSINYWIEIMFLRKLMRWVLYPSFMPLLLSKLLKLSEWNLTEHRQLLISKKKMTHGEWVSMNTDGPNCPLAKVYNRAEALKLFKDFQHLRTDVWFFDRSHWPGVGKMLPEDICRWLGRNWGWHRMVYGRKA
jgi:2-polyprenyl-3-methyl-5-hydroxy-6-metoxy-1,4-benzoquinol methylase